jgi:hypothetical protein
MKFGDIHEINSVLQQIQNEEKTKVVESCGCGCGTKEECTCGPECSSCDCHSESVKESDAKPIYDLVGSLGAGKIELADNPIFHDLVRFLDADTIEKFVADFREKLDNGESVKEVAQHGTTEYYRELDKGQLNHTKSMLMKTAGQLEVAINQRSKFSRELMTNGNRAGTGDLYNMLDKLNKLIEEWDEQTELYGM